ncbi:hypothetical protein HI914_00804 [Erysiphe necator]|nr:hypothetical protein HI914_00804 [Erysiphe necator]
MSSKNCQMTMGSNSKILSILHYSLGNGIQVSNVSVIFIRPILVWSVFRITILQKKSSNIKNNHTVSILTINGITPTGYANRYKSLSYNRYLNIFRLPILIKKC